MQRQQMISALVFDGLAVVLLSVHPPLARADVYLGWGDSGIPVYSDRREEGFVLYLGTGDLPIGSPAHRQSEKTFRADGWRFSSQIEQAAAENDLSPALLHAIVQVESGYNPSAVSPKGAIGLMQLMPATARRFGVSDRYDPVSNLRAGARYLRELLDRFGELPLALAAYNAGEGTVLRYARNIPPYPETMAYVHAVQRRYALLSPGS